MGATAATTLGVMFPVDSAELRVLAAVPYTSSRCINGLTATIDGVSLKLHEMVTGAVAQFRLSPPTAATGHIEEVIG